MTPGSKSRVSTTWWLGVLILPLVILCLMFVPPDARADQSARTSPPKGYRKLGPGVETTIPAKPDVNDTVTRHDMTEIQSAGKELDWKPETQSQSQTLGVLTKDIPFRRDVWYLEFTFKPLRMIDVDMPRPDGRMDRRQIWYMVYHVKNLGQHLDANAGEANDKSPATDAAATSAPKEVFFHPQFVLESSQVKKAYLDRVMPLAVEAIEKRDDPGRKLLNSVEMSAHPIPLSTADDDRSVWGVATWEYVDPRMNFFSIYVKGLTDAYRFADPSGAYKPGDPPGTGRVFAQKTLQLNFWRPADQYNPHESEIYFGIPGEVDHLWVFR